MARPVAGRRARSLSRWMCRVVAGRLTRAGRGLDWVRGQFPGGVAVAAGWRGRQGVTVGPPPPARMPASAPNKADLDERDRYATMTAASIKTVRASAKTWRTGLTAFITVVTDGVVIRGRDTTAGLAEGWRALVMVLVGGGLLLAVVGLWQALAAEVGTDTRGRPCKTSAPVTARWPPTRFTWPTRRPAASSGGSGGRRRGRFLLAGIAVAWWAPAGAAPTQAAYIRVTRGQIVTCGNLPSPAQAHAPDRPRHPQPCRYPLLQHHQPLGDDHLP